MSSLPSESGSPKKARQLGIACLVLALIGGVGLWWRGQRGESAPPPLALHRPTAASQTAVDTKSPTGPVSEEKAALLRRTGVDPASLAGGREVAITSRQVSFRDVAGKARSYPQPAVTQQPPAQPEDPPAFPLPAGAQVRKSDFPRQNENVNMSPSDNLSPELNEEESE